MSNYVQSTNFATKDSLPSGDPLKIVKGTEINTEFVNIAVAVATKADSNSPTLITPVLGTPASGTLTNCTGLPIDGGTTGTLPVARGGSGVTTSTGSGNNVLSNSPTLSSPTLTTPVLGTPASGNLANCTFPTLNQNTTGTAAGLSTTLVVGSGGTGATSFTAGALLKGNGSSALQVASAADIVGQIGANAVTNATNATNATKLATTGFSIEESGGKLIFKNGSTVIASMTSAGEFIALGNVTGAGTP